MMAQKQPYTQAFPDYNSHDYNAPDSGDYQMQSGADYNGAAFHTDKYGTPYEDDALRGATPRDGSKWKPKSWSKRTRIIVGIITAIVVIVVVVVAAVEGTKANAYPNYSPLSYSLDTSMEPASFFDNFNYWDTYDPAQGFVHYDNPIDAKNRNLTFESSNAAFLRVDNKETDASTGRHSARVASKKTWSSGLFLFDIQHSPYGCATWPAVWLSDQSNWPNNGEIDVIEAWNQATSGVQSTLHTTKGCSMNVKRKQTGKVDGTNCYNGTNDNAGCGVTGPASTYGQDFNNNGGGVYATEWRSAGIRMWFFPRASLPGDVSSAIGSQTSTASPDPSKWGEPLADFPSTDCSISSHFRNASIIANIDVCGQLAGAKFTSDGCPGNCQQYATSTPSAFDNAFWQFGSFKVYKAAGEA